MIVAGCVVGQVPELPLLPRLLLSKAMLLGAVESYHEGMVPVVLLYDVGVAVVVPAVIVALANILVVPTIEGATSLIVTGRAIGEFP